MSALLSHHLKEQLQANILHDIHLISMAVPGILVSDNGWFENVPVFLDISERVHRETHQNNHRNSISTSFGRWSQYPEWEIIVTPSVTFNRVAQSSSESSLNSPRWVEIISVCRWRHPAIKTAVKTVTRKYFHSNNQVPCKRNRYQDFSQKIFPLQNTSLVWTIDQLQKSSSANITSATSEMS